MSGPALQQTGGRLGPYELIAPLGIGGMSEVHRARDVRLDREVAVKILDFEAAREPERLRLFEHEARAAGAVNHPAIVAVHDVGREGDVPYVVLELVEGETLQRRLVRGRVPQRRAVDIAAQIAHGLAAAHARGILHNDLKPANVVLTRDGRVKILDFGLAGLRGTGAPSGVAEDAPPRDTVTQALFGTPGYIAPERIEGGAPDVRSDIFSLGALLYEMLAGTPAFGGGSVAEVLSATTDRDPPEIVPALPTAVDRIVRRALEKDPLQRFQSASDFAYALEAISFVTGTPAALGPPRNRRRWVRGLALGLLGAALLATGATLGTLASRRPLPTFQRITFRYGAVAAARFHGGGDSVVYSAVWDGHPRQAIFTARTNVRGALPFEVDGQVVAVSRNGELAYFPDRPYPALHEALLEPGVKLATVPLSGGAPREVLRDVVAADWSPRVYPDGSRLAVVRDQGGRRRLEFPIGRTLYQTAYGLRAPRFSPSGDRIAVIESEAQGDSITVFDLEGGRKVLTQGITFTSSVLGWSPDGNEVWFSAERVEERARAGSWRPVLRGVSLSGRERVLLRLPEFPSLQDVAPDGRVLMTTGALRAEVLVKRADQEDETNLSWHEGAGYAELSRDGQLLLFFEQAERATYLRPTNGGPALRVCDEMGMGLSPDARWVVRVPRFAGTLELVPTQAGETRTLPAPKIEVWGVHWFSDGAQLLLTGSEQGRPVRAWVVDTRTGVRRAITPEGIGCWLVSPDGRTAACARPGGEGYFYPIEPGGEPRPLAGFADGDHMRQWSADGRYLYVSESNAVPPRVHKIDVQSGERTLWRELKLDNPAGVMGTTDPAITPDGATWAWAVMRHVNDLFVVEGLR